MHRAVGNSLQAQRNHSTLELFKLTDDVVVLSECHAQQGRFDVSGQGRYSAGQPMTQSLKLFAFFSKLCGNCAVSWKGHALRELEDGSLCGGA